MPNDTTTSEDDMQLSPFSAFLTAHRKGLMNEELTALMADLVRAVNEHKKKGTLTITFDVRPYESNSGKVMEGVLIITDDVIVKPPRAARDSSMWYPDDVGNLHRNDPAVVPFEGMRAVKGGKDSAANTEEGAVNQ